MPSLQALVDAHGSVLLLDSASASVQVGLWRAGAAPAWWASATEAATALFAGAEALGAPAALRAGTLGALVFCEGPGSILGIRTAAMALRTWQALAPAPLPVFAYRSLELVAHDLAARGVPRPFAVVADARRDRWHCLAVAPGAAPGPLQRVAPDHLAALAGTLYTPAELRAWARAPRPLTPEPYALAGLWARQAGADLLRPAPEPEAFSHEEPSYVAWSPQVHRAPRSAVL